MSLSTLIVEKVRNINRLEMSPGPGFNLIYGENGSGKTSLLEAIFYLSTAKSFRTHLTHRMIQADASECVIFAIKHRDHQQHSLGIQKNINGSRQIRINNENTSSVAALASHLPTQLITTASYRFFHDGPKSRRQFIDWGLFHMKPNFTTTWKAYNTALKQRNAAIKGRRYSQEINTWNHQLIESGNIIDQQRSEYINNLRPILKDLLSILLPELPELNIQYSQGWPQQQSLEAALINSYQQDNRLGYTTKGPHRADLQLYHQQTPAVDFLSQGQQKLAICGLKLAQGKLLATDTLKPPLYLIDDLPSELDDNKLGIICHQLAALNSQTFITAINKQPIHSLLIGKDTKVFHMKQGQASPLK